MSFQVETTVLLQVEVQPGRARITTVDTFKYRTDAVGFALRQVEDAHTVRVVVLDLGVLDPEKREILRYEFRPQTSD